MPLFSKSRSKPKRETMLSRSERIIGKPIQDESQDEQTETSSNQDGSSKRRSQVLKAQRAHRRRTQNYILELEKEVLRLRQREAELVAELEHERSHSHSQFGTQVSAPQSSAVPTVAIDLSDYARIEPRYPCSKVSVGVESIFAKPPVEGLAGLTGSTFRGMNGSAENPFQTDPQSAIDFILDLERPCLAHIKYDLTNNSPTPFQETNLNYGRGHSCTASAKIIQSCPNTDWAQKIDVPEQAIESLLANSRSLPLGPEMTPVQVWQLLTDVGKNQNVSAAKFEFFKEELRKYMRCNSFGTSIPIDYLRQLMNFCFPGYQAAHLHDTHVPANGPELDAMNTVIGSDWDQYF